MGKEHKETIGEEWEISNKHELMFSLNMQSKTCKLVEVGGFALVETHVTVTESQGNADYARRGVTEPAH